MSSHRKSALGGNVIAPTHAYVRTPEGSMVWNGEYVDSSCRRVMRWNGTRLICTRERAPYLATWQLVGPPAPLGTMPVDDGFWPEV